LNRRKPVEYVDQSASGLALNLIEGPVDIDDIDRFTVFRTATVERPDITIRAAIIGASHVLSFATPGTVLTEMFACTESVGGANRILFGPIGDLLEATTELTFADGRRYRFNASLAAPAAVARLRARATRGRQSLHLSFTFPRRPDRRAPPETIVALTHGRQHVVTETAHCYPDEDKVVITSSELTWSLHPEGRGSRGDPPGDRGPWSNQPPGDRGPRNNRPGGPGPRSNRPGGPGPRSNRPGGRGPRSN
jgi:hypothetical protein